jgi:hypothetical protein
VKNFTKSLSWVIGAYTQGPAMTGYFST